MVKTLLKSKVLLSIIIITSLLLATLFIYIPKVTQENTTNSIIRNSQNIVEQIKLNRAYYVSSVVNDVRKYAPELSFDYDHQGTNGKLPFPTTTIHDLSKIYSENTGLTLNFYSEYPFSPKQNRELSPSQKEAIEFIKHDEQGLWVKKDSINGKPVLRVAVADYMTDISCVNCHNSHPDRTWEKDQWKLGDKRGVLEVITPIEEDIKANNHMRDQILIFIAGALLLLVIYYSFMLIKRENELLSANELLDKKIKEEVAKSTYAEKQLIQQSRTAAMGEMMGAIIHQWKQPLNTISIANSAVDMHIMLDDFDKELLSKQTKGIQEQIEYMTTTMNDFRNFFLTQEQSCFKLKECIDDVYKLVGKVYEVQKITISKEMDENVFVNGYKNELNQVIINVMNNARDAILENDPKIKTIFLKVFKEENYGIITITDCAGGIPEHIIDDIFKPYVTTKSKDKGTGIGLDMSKSIMEKGEGSIEAKNVITTIDGKTYKGACFTLKLHSCK